MDVLFGFHGNLNDSARYTTYYDIEFPGDLNDAITDIQFIWMMEQATSITFRLDGFDNDLIGTGQCATIFELYFAYYFFYHKVTNPEVFDGIEFDLIEGTLEDILDNIVDDVEDYRDYITGDYS